jgi:hypothetical protein
VQWTVPSALLYLALGCLGRIHRRIPRHADERVEPRLKPFDALETRLHQLHRRHPAMSYEFADVGQTLKCSGLGRN